MAEARRVIESLTRALQEAQAVLDALNARGGDEAPEKEGAPPGQEFIACTPRQLPKRLLVEAAKTAVDLNPQNAPHLQGPTAALGGEARALLSDPLHIAVLTSKYWGTQQRTLGVSFLEQTAADLRDRILLHMNAWSTRCGISFKWSQSRGDIRISRGSGGYWSYLGTDVLSIPARQPTMTLERFSMSTPESEYLRVVRHETGHCLSGDTFVDCPRDLEKYPLGIPVRELVGQRPWVYGWKDGRVVVRRAARVWLTKKDAEVVRVRLGANPGPGTRAFLPPLELVGTPDHLVLLADGGTWKPLGRLQPGDRLCSLYRSKNGPRSRLLWTGLGERVREHAFVAGEVYGARPEGHDAHHLDGRMLNQTPENLEWKPEALHHRDHALGRADTPETSRRRSEAQARRAPPTGETRAKMAASARNRPPASAETREKIGTASRGKPQSGETVARRTAGMRRFYDGGGRSGMFGKTATAETRRKRSESMKATLARKRAAANHVVLSVEPAGRCDVYDLTVPDADSFVANGVVVHNSLGFPHEHMRAEIVQRLDPQKTIDYFRRTQGWDAETVRQQVLTPLEERSLMATPADVTSIMAYQLPGEICKDGRPIPGGLDINESDFAFAGKIYPKPGGGGGDEDIDWLV